MYIFLRHKSQKAPFTVIFSSSIFCLQESITKSQEAHYNEVASVLRNVLPSAAPSSPIGHEWLQTFADNLKHELEKRDAEKKQLETQVQEKTVLKHVEKVEGVQDTRVKELSAQNEHLQGLVDKYKTIIDDTVRLLLVLFTFIFNYYLTP